MDDQTLLKEALTDELGDLYKTITRLTTTTSLPEDDLQLLRGLVSVLQFATRQMADQQAADGALTTDVTVLREKLEKLQQENSAYQKQLDWLKDRVALSRTATGRTQLKANLKHTLDVAVDITQADSGSLFLLDDSNVVTECILTRSGTTERERHQLVGQVLEKGLAGWVLEHQKVETISDTALDTRWVNLANQPYKVRSVLCVPMVGSSRVLGIMTLTHPEPKHFQSPWLDLVGAMAEQTALVLESTRLRYAHKILDKRLRRHQEFCCQILATEIVAAVVVQDNKFVHVNGLAADLFGQKADMLLQLPSITSVIAYEDLNQVKASLEICSAKLAQVFNLDFGITHENGQVIPISARGITLDFQKKPAVMMMMNKALQ